MHQETNAAKSSKRGDLLTVIGLLLLLIVSRTLISAAGGGTLGGIIQLMVFLLLVSVCYLVYKHRLVCYRYTLFNKEPEEGELDEYGEQAKNPFPLGTLIIEQITGGKAKAVEIIAPAELVALIRPDGPTVGVMADTEKNLTKKKLPTLLCVDRKKGSVLVYRRDKKLLFLCFAPSAELTEMIEEIISAINRA